MHHQPEVFEYVMKNKKDMPRTALRYAIEKLPKDLRDKAMEK
ncbi:MAG: DNA alkylation repair protein [Methanosarcina sp.]